MTSKNSSQAGPEVELRVKEVSCWKCALKTKIALLFIGSIVEDPSVFSPGLVALAQGHGVRIEEFFSNTQGRSYLANVCHACNAPFGEFHLHDYFYDKDLVVMPIETHPKD